MIIYRSKKWKLEFWDASTYLKLSGVWECDRVWKCDRVWESVRVRQSDHIDPEFIFFSQNWLRHHILQPQLSIQKSYVVCIYVQYTNILFRYKVLVSPRLAHTRAANIHTTHKGARASRAPTTIPMGHALRARPIGIVVFPFVCGVNVGGTCAC